LFTRIKSYMESFRNPPADFYKELMSAETSLYASSTPNTYNPDTLAVRKGGLRIYDKMRKDDTIRACLSLKKYAVLSTGWSVDPAIEEEKDEGINKEVAKFIESNFNLMNGSFDDILLQIMTAFDYGYSVTEKLFSVKENKIMLDMLKTRKPHGISFATDKFGNLLEDGVIQANNHFPSNKFIIFVNNPEFNNWYGESDLRSCYRAWWSKDNILKFWNMYLERYSMPPVVGKIKSAMQDGDVTKLQNILKRLQTASSATIPDGVEVEFLETKGKGAVSYEAAVEKHDMAMARALLVPNLLGVTAQGDTGSYSQSRTHFNVFLWIILKARRTVEELINEGLVRELVDYNYRVEAYPTFKFLPLDDDKKIEIARLWIEAVDKASVTSDGDDENVLRSMIGFPEKEVDVAGDKERARIEKEKADKLIVDEKKAADKVIKEAEKADKIAEKERIASEKEAKKAAKEAKKNNANALPAGGVELSSNDFAANTLDRALTKYEKRANFKKIEKTLDKLEEESREKIVEVLTKQMEVLQSFLTKKIESDSLTPKLINTLQLKHLRELQQVIKETLREAYRFGQERALKELSKKNYQRIPPAYAIDYLTNKSFYIKGVLESSILNGVKGTLLSSLESGEGMKETMLKVEQIYKPYIGTEIISDLKQVSPYRIETMMRTNTTGAFNNGRVAMGYDKDLKDYIVAYQYSAVIDDRTTPVCMELDGKIIRKDDPDFDRFVPPQHFNCRSILVPVTTDDEPFKTISREESDNALALTPESFGGRVGGITPKKDIFSNSKVAGQLSKC